MSTGHTIQSFVNTVFLDELRRMTYDYGLHYLAFGTIAVGIEFLGACEDLHPFEHPGQSKSRFTLGIDKYMANVDSRYSSYNNENSLFFLYKHLRCGMAHIMRPQGNIGFTCREAAQKAGHSHLSLLHGEHVLLMTAEDFYDDFEKACGFLLSDLPNKTEPKFQSIYLPVSEIPRVGDDSNEMTSLSGT
jgi:hypothetical protein